MRRLACAVGLLAMSSGCIPFAVEGLHGGENIRATLAGQPPRVLRSHSPDRRDACWAARRDVYSEPDPWEGATPPCAPPAGWNALLLPVNLVSLASLGFTPSVLVLDDGEALGGTDRFTRVMRGWHVEGGGDVPAVMLHIPWIFFFWPGTWEPGRDPELREAPPEYFEALLDHPDPEVRGVAVRHLADCRRTPPDPYGPSWLLQRALDETSAEARGVALELLLSCVGDCTTPGRRRRVSYPLPIEPNDAPRIRNALLAEVHGGGAAESSARALLACLPRLGIDAASERIERPDDTGALMRTVELLEASDENEDDRIRRQLLARLARLEPPLAPPEGWLRVHLQRAIDDRPHAQRADVRLLLGCGRTTVDILERETPSKRFRAAGLRTLCSEPLAADPRAERLLAEGLRDGSEAVRTAAALALLARGDASPAVISAAVEAIFPTRRPEARGGPGAMEWVELLARAGEDDAPARPRARRCPWLVTVPYPHFEGPVERVSPEAVYALEALLGHPDEAIREATVATLLRLVATRPDVAQRWPHIRARLADELLADLPSSL